MGWISFGIAALLTTLIFVSVKYWKKLWPAGIAGILVIFPIEWMFTGCGAYRFVYDGLKVVGMPLPYWLSFFPGGILFARFYPDKLVMKFMYILASAAILLLMEIIMMYFGYFIHEQNWNAAKSYALNLYGFVIMSWLADLINSINSKEHKDCA